MNCPICGAEIDEDYYKVAERLSNLGYMHLDVWVKCPKCKYTPCFGKELEDPQPIYWYPKQLKKWFKTKVVEAFNKFIPNAPCVFCGSEMELHKIWINTWRENRDSVITSMDFLIPSPKGEVVHHYLPSGFLGQYKCKNWKCKYVRYVTL